MNLIPSSVAGRFSRQALILDKNKPQILFGTGIVLMGATVVSACRATLKLNDELDAMRKDLIDVETSASINPERTERDVKKMQTYIYARNAARVGKLYAPAVVFGSLSVAALTSSHRIMSRRNAGLSAALAATTRAWDNYRDRVREEYGEEKEMDLYTGRTVTKQPVIDDEGRETKSKKNVVTGGGKSPYAMWWGKDSTFEWSEDSAFNLARLSGVQEWANARLRYKKHLFLNEVLDQLGLERHPAGQVVGWLYDHKDARDEFVTFGIFNADATDFLDFVQGHEDGIWLDFNVDGEIWRLI